MAKKLHYKFNNLTEIYTLNDDAFNVGILVLEVDDYAMYISIDEEGKRMAFSSYGKVSYLTCAMKLNI